MTLGWKLIVMVIGVVAGIAYGVVMLDHYDNERKPKWDGTEVGSCNPGGRVMQIDDPSQKDVYAAVAEQFKDATPIVTTKVMSSEAVANSAKW